jgi:hypothetical protein
MTRSLLAFADHNQVLSSAIPAVPALEALGADRSVKNSQDIVAALEASASDMFKLFLRSFKARVANLSNLFRKNKEYIYSGLVRMQVLYTFISEGRVFNGELAKKKTIKLLSYTHLIEGLQSADKFVDVLRKIHALRLPMSVNSYEIWLDTFRKEFNSISHLTGVEVSQTGVFHQASGMSAIYVKKTMIELGYDGVDKFNNIMALLPKVYEAEDIIITMNEKIESHVYEMETEIERDSIGQVTQRAAIAMMDGAYYLERRLYWLAGTQGLRAMKAIFACTEKVKPGKE